MLTNRELASVLAGLRLLQQAQRLGEIPELIADIQTDLSTLEPLDGNAIDDLCSTLGGAVGLHRGDSKYLTESRKHIGTNPSPDLLISSISELSARLRNALTAMGFKTVGDLANLSRWRFEGEPNIGRTSTNQLEEFLGRQLSSARFEEIEGEDFATRRGRLAQWYKDN